PPRAVPRACPPLRAAPRAPPAALSGPPSGGPRGAPRRGGGPVRGGRPALLARHNRRYGGFVVHLGILVIAVGVTGSQAWSVQTETTLKVGESTDLGGDNIPRARLGAGERAQHPQVVRPPPLPTPPPTPPTPP